MLRKTLLFIAIFIALVLLALFLLPTFVDSKKLLDPVLAQIEESSGVKVQVNGDTQLAILPRPGFTLKDIAVQLPEDSSPSISAREFNLGIRLFPLLSRRVEVERFALDSVVFSEPGDNSKAPPELDLNGRFSFAATNQRLTLEAVDATLRGLIPEPVQLTLSGPIDLQSQTADLAIHLAHGDVKGEGSVIYAAQESPKIDAKLHLNRFSPALYALAGPEAAADNTEPQESAPEEAQPLPLDALRTMDTRADLRIDEVVWQGHTIRNLHTRLRVVNGNAIVPTLTGKVHGGDLAMKANFNTRPEIPRINTSGTLTGLDIASLLAALEVEPAMIGGANLDWELHGQGVTGEAIRDSLRGPVKLTTTQAALTVIGVEREFCQLVATANRESMAVELPETTRFEQLSATIQLKDGKALLQPLQARLPQMGLTGRGELDLASQEFDALINAQLSPELEQLDPACRVNERLTAIKWPVECAGNLAGEPKEWCSVDSDAILKDLGENELKRKLEKEVEKRYGEDAGAALKKLLGK